MATQNQDRLRTHFASAPSNTHNSRWDDLWKEGTFLPWDRGYANPALIDLLAGNPAVSDAPNPTPGAPSTNSSKGWEALGSPFNADGSRRRVLIPGCGKGYDVLLFAANGFDAVGLEVSEHAADAARKYVDEGRGKEGRGPLEGEYEAAAHRHGKPWGRPQVVQGDYFADDWVGDDGFDIIYDNTFLCALPPDLRTKWAARTVSLLKKHGALICLEFPTHKPASSGGPPWSLPPTVHAELLKRPGEEISYDDNGVVVATDRPEAENALVRVAHYVPKRTHEVGVIKGVVRDCVSIWKHKASS